MQEQDKNIRFEQFVLPHLSAAFNLARWLTSSDTDAEDVVQEAYLRAFKFFGGFHGADGRAWLLTIVRNTCYTWLQQNRLPRSMIAFDEELHGIESQESDPEMRLLQDLDNQLLKQAIAELPLEFREVLVLREIEGLSYKEIATIAEIPLGTVMSRLTRARKRLQLSLANRMNKEPKVELPGKTKLNQWLSGR